MNQKIRIKLKSFDHNLVDKSAEKIVKTVKSTGAVVSGPVPLPTRKQIFTVNRSTFVNKKAREQFQLCTCLLYTSHRGGNLLQFEVIADGLVVVVIDRIIIYKEIGRASCRERV